MLSAHHEGVYFPRGVLLSAAVPHQSGRVLVVAGAALQEAEAAAANRQFGGQGGQQEVRGLRTALRGCFTHCDRHITLNLNTNTG